MTCCEVCRSAVIRGSAGHALVLDALRLDGVNRKLVEKLAGKTGRVPYARAPSASGHVHDREQLCQARWRHGSGIYEATTCVEGISLRQVKSPGLIPQKFLLKRPCTGPPWCLGFLAEGVRAVGRYRPEGISIRVRLRRGRRRTGAGPGCRAFRS